MTVSDSPIQTAEIIVPSSNIRDDLPFFSKTLGFRLEQIFPLLLDAVANDSAWLADFSEEPVTISDDLYDVILAYRHFRKN